MGGGAEAGRQAPSVATRAAGCRHWGVDTGALTAGCGGSCEWAAGLGGLL